VNWTLALWIATSLVGVAGSAACSGIETGIYRVGRLRLNARAAARPPIHAARALQRELDHPDRTLTALLVCNNAFNYLGSLGVAGLLTLASLSESAIIVLQALVLTPLLLVFAESLPKEVFRQNADRLAERAVWVLVALRLAATISLALPIVLAIARGVARLLGVSRQRALASPRERVATMLKSASAEGAFSGVQSNLADRALAFGAATVALEMVPWTAVHKIPADIPRDRLAPLLARTPHARYPVVDATGRVLGVLDQLDAHLRPGVGVRALIQDVPRVSPADSAHEALITIRAARARLAIVERHGRPVGMVTPKDLFEPLVGELESW